MNDVQEAIAFDEKVKKKLRIIPKRASPCDYGEANMCTFDCMTLSCDQARLKWARLLVEKELNEVSYD